MKGREVRAMLQGKVEPVVVQVLCGIAENASAQQQEIVQLAEMLNNVTDILMQLGATVEGATNAVDEMKKIRGDG
jgi:hypothetical protein